MPNLISVEAVNDAMSKMLPAVSGKEIEFYHKHTVTHIYEKILPDGKKKFQMKNQRKKFQNYIFFLII